MAALPVLKGIGIEAYFEMAAESLEKLEYVDGEVYAMAGASIAHNEIFSNAFEGIAPHLAKNKCRIYGSDLRIEVKTKSSYVYPDLSIVCNGLQFSDLNKNTITNPVVIIEILSPDTEAYDRGKKFALYRQIQSLKEYILVSSTRVSVERFSKTEEGQWQLKDYNNLSDELELQSVQHRLPLSTLYRNVIFEEEED